MPSPLTPLVVAAAVAVSRKFFGPGSDDNSAPVLKPRKPNPGSSGAEANPYDYRDIP